MDLKERTSWIITDVIKKYQLSNAKLAKKIGCNTGTINNYRRKNNVPNGDFIETFCKLFYINPSWFITGDGEPYDASSIKPFSEGGDEGYNIANRNFPPNEEMPETPNEEWREYQQFASELIKYAIKQANYEPSQKMKRALIKLIADEIAFKFKKRIIDFLKMTQLTS